MGGPGHRDAPPGHRRGAAPDPRPLRRAPWRRSACASIASSSRRSPTRRSTPAWSWSTADSRHEVDARPSDAIALAVRLECPIYASARGAGPGRRRCPTTTRTTTTRTTRGAAAREAARDARRSGWPQARSRRPARRLDPTKLDIFREFVNSLEPDGGDPRSGGRSQRVAAAQPPRIGLPRRQGPVGVRPQAQTQHPEVLHRAPDDRGPGAGRRAGGPRVVRDADLGDRAALLPRS